MAYVPVSTMFNTPYSSSTVLSPLTPLSITRDPLSPIAPLSPFSPFSTVTQSVVVNNNPLTITTPIGPVITTRPTYVVDIDTGMDDNFIVQRDVTKYFLYITLDKWLYTEFPNVLKYLVVERGHVRVVKSEDEKEKNKVSNNSSEELEMKADYIEDNVLDEKTMREVLMRIMRELGIRWYNLPHREPIVMDVVEKYLKKKLREKMGGRSEKLSRSKSKSRK